MTTKEANKLLRSPKIVFNNGISDNNEDTANGFVTQLENMEIRNNGITRRLGSKLLNQKNNLRKYYFMEEVEVSGCSILIGLDTNRRLYCWVEEFEEMDFEVHNDTFLTGDNSGNVFFTRGAKFFTWSNQEYFYIMNDYGDAIDICLNGHISFRYGGSETLISTTYDKLRGSDGYDLNDYVCYLNIRNVTNKKLENFFITADPDKEHIPIQGNIRVASVNEAGIISEFSEPVFIPEKQHSYISTIPVYPTRDVDGSKYISPTFATQAEQQADDAVIFERSWNTALDTFSQDIITYPTSTTVLPIDAFMFYVNTDNTGATTLDNDSLYFWLPSTSLTTSSNLGRIFRISNMEAIDPTTSLSVDLAFNSAIYTKMTGHIPNFNAPTTAYTTSASSITTTSVLTSAIKIDSSFLKLSNIFQKFRDYNIREGGISKYKFNGLFLKAEVAFSAGVPVYYDFGGGVNQGYVSYKDNDLWSRNGRLEHLGADHWQDTEIYPPDTIKGDVKDIDPMTGEIEIRTSLNTDLYFNKSAASFSGEQFVVIKNNSVIAKSQLAVSNEETIIYDLETERIKDGSANEQTGFTLKKWKVPVTNLALQSLRSYPINRSIYTQIITNVKDMAFNNGKLYVIQGGKLWIGDTSLLLKDFIQISSTIEHIVGFSDGCLVFTQGEGIIRINRENKKTITEDHRAKAVARGAGGVFFISNDNKVYFAHMVYQENGVPFIKFEEISQAIYNVDWDDDPKMIFINDTLYIARDKDVWGFFEGGWKKRYTFNDETIESIHKYRDELVVVFLDDVDVSANSLETKWTVS
jgi:hypothetical protein